MEEYEMFLEQIIGNIGIFEYVSQNNDIYLICVDVSKSKEDCLLGHYYKFLPVINNDYDVIIHGEQNKDNKKVLPEFNINSFKENSYYKLKINPDTTYEVLKEIKEKCRKISLYSRFVSAVLFNDKNGKEDGNSLEKWTDKVLSYNDVKKELNSSDNIYNVFENLIKIEDIGMYMASVALYYKYPEKTTIYKKDVYNFLVKIGILNNKRFSSEQYKEYNEFFIAKLKQANSILVDENIDSLQVANYLNDFKLDEFLIKDE